MILEPDMLVVTITACLLFILLSAHQIVFPMTKRRPIFIKGIEGSLIFVTFISAITPMLSPLGYMAAIFIGLLFYLSNSWLVLGVSKENIENALIRAISASRSTHKQNKNMYTIDNAMEVKVNKLAGKTVFIRYNRSISKKAKLTKNIFRKFVDNYFI